MTTFAESLGKDIGLEQETSASGDYQALIGMTNLKKSLLRRLIATPGSIVTLPTYGVGIKNYQNAPLSIGKQREIANRINEQFLLDPRIAEVNSVKILVDPNNSSLVEISVNVTVVGAGDTNVIFEDLGEI